MHRVLSGAAADLEDLAPIREVLPQDLEYGVSIALAGIGVGFGRPHRSIGKLEVDWLTRDKGNRTPVAFRRQKRLGLRHSQGGLVEGV